MNQNRHRIMYRMHLARDAESDIWVARSTNNLVVSQGKSREEEEENLHEAIEFYCEMRPERIAEFERTSHD
jgi:predicted RNase H-like HicB family nuclease